MSDFKSLNNGESLEINHVGGIPWHEAPLPRRFHRCKAQTIGYVNYFDLIERCACGALRRDGSFWFDKNQRRKEGER